MKILVACEESQAVTKEFRALGHEAYSCDLVECSGGHPEWHLQQDVTEILEQKWDMILAFPPCTFLTVTGNRWFNVERYGEKAIKRHQDRKEAIDFFMMFANADCDKIAIENPIGIMSSTWEKPTQIIQPWMFGQSYTKSTCLWLKGLPKLEATEIVEKGKMYEFKSGKKMSWFHYESFKLPPKERAAFRSKTPEGIAKAMAEQWAEKV